MNTETVARATFGLAQVLREALQNSREFPAPAVPYPEPAINPRGDACHASSLRQFARASNTPSDHHVLSALLSPRVVIGFDARHHSAEFARVTAEVIAGAGGKAELMPRVCPTPLLAFYLRESGADAGVMITASHNPARDNGYKVYLGGRVVTGLGSGAQLVVPWDARIMAAIDAAPSAAKLPLADSYSLIDDSLWSRYRERAVSLVESSTSVIPSSAAESSGDSRLTFPSTGANLPFCKVAPGRGLRGSTQARAALRIVHTSLHGVGAELAETVLEDAGFSSVFSVEAQCEPDPDFPTVSFPNPEEAGALDLAIERAREVEADLILANDPDADRVAAAVPCPRTPTGWRQLTGDEVGVLLGWQACEQWKNRAERTAAYETEPTVESPAERTVTTVARSLVSGELLDAVARAAGLQPMVSLTGFKWIARTPGLIYGYEEALGVCPDPAAVRDKDGISAGLRLAVLAADLRAEGRTCSDLLDELAIQHGLYATAPLTIRVSDLSAIAKGMANLRERGLTRLGEEPVTFTLDLSSNQPADPKETSVLAAWENLRGLPATDALFFGASSGTRVVVRPSGTEPKLKCYLQVVIPEVTRRSLREAHVNAAAALELIRNQLHCALAL